ncbi:hypothetical protein [Frondihabitans australicus]|uniref:Uncharacterized protein n=1 Tax=Frondihabitans australicus TaxID=386892 RepID=A0A495IHS1_9MICO|nr:hypothetical protein [Frondihabitans australicus]RKR74861.1 hypothetical protein C8E83_1993 [Frondihabitans australicus]
MSLDPEKVVAAFDSASVLHASTVAALTGRAFPNLGNPRIAGDAARIASHLPWSVLGPIYARIGGAEGIDPETLADVDLSRVAASFAGAYDGGLYPAVFIGSSNGALTHLAAAMGAPWLPGTVLIPVHHVGDAERADRALDFGREVGPRLLRSNPDVTLHQMHDSAQDQLMVARMAYFRTKWSTLPDAYARFLGDALAPDAPVYLIHDESTWPVTRVGDRHAFQVGGRGGVTPDEYLAMPYAPQADDTSPEAEWGSDPGFSQGVRDWCAANGHTLVDIVVDGPQEASHPVAEIIRDWTRFRGGEADRLVVPSFVLGDPGETLRIGAVPFWTFFPVESALDSLRFHLQNSEPYNEVDAFLFQHGAESPRRVTPDDVRATIQSFGQGAFAHLPALRADASPHDIGAMGRYRDFFSQEPTARLDDAPLAPDEVTAALGSIVGERGRTLVTTERNHDG